MQHRRSLGQEGERLAAEHLARRGYRIVGRNVRADRVEIDLIATRPGLVVFVEVKTRGSHGFGLPEEAVDTTKRRRLVRGARAWLRTHGRPGLRARFDVVAVERADGRLTVRHLPAAFDAAP